MNKYVSHPRRRGNGYFPPLHLLILFTRGERGQSLRPDKMEANKRETRKLYISLRRGNVQAARKLIFFLRYFSEFIFRKQRAKCLPVLKVNILVRYC